MQSLSPSLSSSMLIYEVLIRNAIRNEELSAVGMRPTALNSQRPFRTALTEDSCLAKVMPSSQLVTSNDYYRSPGLLTSLGMVWRVIPLWNSSENRLRLRLIWYQLPKQLPDLLWLSFLFPKCWSLPDRLSHIYSILFISPDHAQNSFLKIPASNLLQVSFLHSSLS